MTGVHESPNETIINQLLPDWAEQRELIHTLRHDIDAVLAHDQYCRQIIGVLMGLDTPAIEDISPNHGPLRCPPQVPNPTALSDEERDALVVIWHQELHKHQRNADQPEN